jgi:hypothetical protein
MSGPTPEPQNQPPPVGGAFAPAWRRWFFVLLCLGLVVIRLIKPDVAVDGTTLWLLGIAALAFTLPEVVKFLADFRRVEVGSVKFERYEREIQQIKQETELEIQRIKQETEHTIQRMKFETDLELRQLRHDTTHPPQAPNPPARPAQPPQRLPKNRLLRAVSVLRGKDQSR